MTNAVSGLLAILIAGLALLVLKIFRIKHDFDSMEMSGLILILIAGFISPMT
jgi:hypothetical protein